MRVRPETLTDRYASTAGGGANARDTRPRASRSPRRVPMSERPEADDDWSTFDHWEADDVIGIGANLHTEVGKKTRFLMASVIPNKTAEQNIGVQQLAIFAPLPAGARLIIMHGNGIESARLRNGLGMDIYFRRPIQFLAADNNENHNGMIRRHPPKHSRIRMDRRATCGKSSTRSATAPCACSTTAHPSRHSSTNC